MPQPAGCYVLGFAFTWDDLQAVARERAYRSGYRQLVLKHESTWVVLEGPDRLPEFSS